MEGQRRLRILPGQAGWLHNSASGQSQGGPGLGSPRMQKGFSSVPVPSPSLLSHQPRPAAPGKPKAECGARGGD